MIELILLMLLPVVIIYTIIYFALRNLLLDEEGYPIVKDMLEKQIEREATEKEVVSFAMDSVRGVLNGFLIIAIVVYSIVLITWLF